MLHLLFPVSSPQSWILRVLLEFAMYTHWNIQFSSSPSSFQLTVMKLWKPTCTVPKNVHFHFILCISADIIIIYHELRLKFRSGHRLGFFHLWNLFYSGIFQVKPYVSDGMCQVQWNFCGEKFLISRFYFLIKTRWEKSVSYSNLLRSHCGFTDLDKFLPYLIQTLEVLFAFLHTR